jgi:hypothetical protein
VRHVCRLGRRASPAPGFRPGGDRYEEGSLRRGSKLASNRQRGKCHDRSRPDFSSNKSQGQRGGWDFRHPHLSFADRLPLDLYTKINKVRKIRNDWKHGAKLRVSAAEARTATEACEGMFKLVSSIEVSGEKGCDFTGSPMGKHSSFRAKAQGMQPFG